MKLELIDVSLILKTRNDYNKRFIYFLYLVSIKCSYFMSLCQRDKIVATEIFNDYFKLEDEKKFKNILRSIEQIKRKYALKYKKDYKLEIKESVCSDFDQYVNNFLITLINELNNQNSANAVTTVTPEKSESVKTKGKKIERSSKSSFLSNLNNALSTVDKMKDKILDE